MIAFQSSAQERLFNATIFELERLGYRNDLLARDYCFPDYFTDGLPERTIAAAAFGQTPLSHRTACFGVSLATATQQGTHPIEHFRALGAPLHFEIEANRVRLWVVGRDLQRTQPRFSYDESDLPEAFRRHVEDWSPLSVLRAKNIGTQAGLRQLDFIDVGLLPALEEQVEKKLDPVLKESFARAQREYAQTTKRTPDARALFRLSFRLLAGRVFHDRGFAAFASLSKDAGPDAVLRLVAEHYGGEQHLPLNEAARQAAFDRIWMGLDFRNLSTEVLTSIWSTTLVTEDVRKSLGIHSTPRTVAKYVVDHLPSESFANLQDRDGLIVEPCCGSATFLIEAMERIREHLPLSMSAEERHRQFRDVLVGFERETFGIEIARLCLSLADFPEKNSWQLHAENVFSSASLPNALRKAMVVLCNPPFQDLRANDPIRAKTQSPHQPLEILRLVLANLHPEGVIGFVMPRKFVDGAWYREMRGGIAGRFGSIELVSLPDVAFRQSDSEHETVLLLASAPRAAVDYTTVRHLRVAKSDWPTFAELHKPTTDDKGQKTVAEAGKSLAVPPLSDVWDYLRGMATLGEMAETSRGLDWKKPIRMQGVETGNRALYVFDEPRPGTREGVPPKAKISSFQKPETKYLCIKPSEQRRNAYKLEWDRPKVILNAARRSRGPWRISAFSDTKGLTCYRTFIAVWPNNPKLATVLAAVLNGPIANAFVTTQEGFNISEAKLKALPVPSISQQRQAQIESAVASYIRAVRSHNWDAARADLTRIDAIVLLAYRLPPRLERRLLDYFRGTKRSGIPFAFGDYFPADFEPCFSLADYISEGYQRSTASEFRSRGNDAPAQVIEAMEIAVQAYQQE